MNSLIHGIKLRQFIIIIIIGISFSGTGYYDSQIANAQNATQPNFLTYTNPTMGFMMQYPLDWVVDESSVSDSIVRFKTSEATLPIFVVSFKEVEPYLDTNTLTLKNTTLDQTVQEKRDFFSQLSSNTGLEYRLIRQTQTTVGGDDAVKLEYVMGSYYSFEVYTIVNGKLYTLVYQDLPLKVPETVKLANKAVESFQIIA